MKNWIIKKFGGYTPDEVRDLQERYDAIPEVWADAVAALMEQDRVTVVEGHAVISNAEIDGSLIVAPRSRAYISGCRADRAYFPVDRESRIH